MAQVAKICPIWSPWQAFTYMHCRQSYKNVLSQVDRRRTKVWMARRKFEAAAKKSKIEKTWNPISTSSHKYSKQKIDN
jgi:hypothetical protein